MKRFFLLFPLFALALVSCKNQNYTISGTTTFEGCEGDPVYLSCGDIKDTTSITDNAFSFSGKIDSPQIGLIQIQNKQKKQMYCYFVLEPGDLKVEISPKSTCTGTPLNEAYRAFDGGRRDLSEERVTAFKAIREDESLTDEEKQAKFEAIWEDYSKKADAFFEETFTAHPNDIIGAEAIMSLGDTRERFDSLYQLAGEAVRNAPRVKKEVERYANLDKTAAGQMFTDFTIENGNQDGSPVKFSDYVGKGKYVLVDFWASWCGPCKAEMPNLASVYEKYKGDKFELVGVAVWDKRKDTEDAIPALNITWPVIFDAQRIPTEIYGIKGIPHIILFGPDGTILARELRGEEIGKTVSQYLDAAE